MTCSIPTVWLALAPGLHATRVLATDAAQRPLLTACLAPDPTHPRALPALLEAVALWQGATVRGVLVADARSATFAPTLCRAAFPLGDAWPLYTLRDAAGPPRRPWGERRGPRGSFADLHAVLRAEVVR
jgi:hypothetical protein